MKAILRKIDAETARAFVGAARHLIDAMLIEGQRVRQSQSPGTIDYDNASFSRSGPAGGWLSDSELRSATQKMSEAIAAEKWTDGVVFALRALSTLGVV